MNNLLINKGFFAFNLFIDIFASSAFKLKEFDTLWIGSCQTINLF